MLKAGRTAEDLLNNQTIRRYTAKLNQVPEAPRYVYLSYPGIYLTCPTQVYTCPIHPRYILVLSNPGIYLPYPGIYLSCPGILVLFRYILVQLLHTFEYQGRRVEHWALALSPPPLQLGGGNKVLNHKQLRLVQLNKIETNLILQDGSVWEKES